MSSLLLLPSFLIPVVTGMLLGANRDRSSYRWIWGGFIILTAVWIGLAMALISQIASAVDGRIVTAALRNDTFVGSIMNNSACRWLFFCLPSIPVFVTALLMFPRRGSKS